MATALQNRKTKPATAMPSLRIDGLDWDRIAAELNGHGCAIVGPLLDPHACRDLAALYAVDAHFRSHIIMASHGFGRGEYK